MDAARQTDRRTGGQTDRHSCLPVLSRHASVALILRDEACFTSLFPTGVFFFARAEATSSAASCVFFSLVFLLRGLMPGHCLRSYLSSWCRPPRPPPRPTPHPHRPTPPPHSTAPHRSAGQPGPALPCPATPVVYLEARLPACCHDTLFTDCLCSSHF